MSLTKKILTAIVSLLILGAIPLTTLIIRGNLDFRSSAKTAGASLTLDPANGAIILGSDFEVNILLNTSNKLITGADMVLTYDPEIISVTDDDPGKEGTQVKAGSLLENPLVSANKNEGDKIYLSVNSFTAYKGAGIFGTVKFHAKKSGTAKITFFEKETKITEQGTTQNILAATNSSQFTIEGATDTDPGATSPDTTINTTPEEKAMTDLNSDGTTNDLDMQLFAKKWGTKDTSVDLDANGKVDQADLKLFTDAFKKNQGVKP